MYSKADPSSSATIANEALSDYPSFLLWSASGDTNFMPSALKAEIKSPTFEPVTGPIKPTDKQRRLSQIKSDIVVDAGPKADVVPVPTKSEAERLIEAITVPVDLSDPNVIVFMSS